MAAGIVHNCNCRKYRVKELKGGVDMGGHCTFACTFRLHIMVLPPKLRDAMRCAARILHMRSRWWGTVMLVHTDAHGCERFALKAALPASSAVAAAALLWKGSWRRRRTRAVVMEKGRAEVRGREGSRMRNAAPAQGDECAQCGNNARKRCNPQAVCGLRP